MAATSETGHARNLARFGELIHAVTGLGTAYNPTASDLQLSSLLQLKNQLEAAFLNLRQAETAHKNAVNARSMAYSSMNQRATRICAALIASGISTEQIKDITGLRKKLTGRRVGTLPATQSPSTTAPVEAQSPAVNAAGQAAPKPANSVSQLSYDNRLQNFADLVAFAASIPAYAPNEADLQISALSNYINSLPQHNNLVSTTRIAQTNALIARDKLLYLPGTGALSIAARVKLYVKSVFGATAPEFYFVYSIRFTKISNALGQTK